ncbi:ABC transporter permease [Virgibacillus profundi]|uniref:ABC transporter permease n=1 Tax=Virgibacillus profundi TaxID=2024555 RepID=A0A2A2IB12_9BACI|nr:ABC transporter permease [Virgibacillus profundi]PAV28253.1 ABC transporter permease [Virgibacillus profundi]PXY52557.1 ABC transporter permease [Virgibacillus profundi]
MAGSITKNTGSLSRFIMRRDRIRIPLWIIGISFFTLMVPIAFGDMYSSQQERDVMAETMQNPAMTAMVGPGNLGNYTIGAMTTHQMLLLTAVVVGLMSILLVNRHTRADEEDGRIEMIRSLPVGRLSNVNATLFVLVITNVVLAMVTGFGLFALGIESMDLEGSLLYGTALGATGILFAGVTAVFAQLSESSRGVIGYSIAVLLLAYLVRAVGDVGNETLSWLSPLGWITQSEAYSNNNWWPILLTVGVSIILFIFANYLNAIRDLEAGFFPARPGRKNASAFLQSPMGLALRLQRTGIIAWAIGLFVMGISYGSVMGDLESFFEGNEMLEQMLVAEEGYSLTEQFIPMLLMVMGILATVPPVMAMNKLIGEEKKNRVEHLLGRAVSRTKLAGSYLLISILNGFIMISLAAIGLWSAALAVMEDGFEFGTIYGAALVYYPAMLVMIGFAVLLIGFLPKLTSLIWLYVVYSFFVLYMGGLFQFPDWVGKFSPFGYIPQLPVESMEWLPIIILTIIAAFLMIIGFIGYNKRDIEG